MLKYLFVGLAASLGFAPFDLFPLTMICFAWFYIQLTTSLSSKLTQSFVFSFGYHIGIIHWLYMPFVIDGTFSNIAIIFAVVAAAAFLSITHTFATGILQLFGISSFLFAATSIFSEYFIYEVFGEALLEVPFPWCYVGYTLSNHPYINQVAYIVKIYGLSFFVYYISALIGNFFITKNKIYLHNIACLLCTLVTYSLYRITTTQIFDFNGLQALIVQPNIKQTNEWRSDKIAKKIEYFSQISKTDKNIIWPESCLPYVFSSEKDLITVQISKVLSSGRYLVMGMVYNNNGKFYNSLGVIDSSGRIIARYDKINLAPFGEFTPMKKFSPIKFLLGDKNEYSAGKYARTISIPNMPKFLPLVCYEIIFPNINIMDAQMIINITNDGWFGDTNAPFQHLGIAKIRAIENNIPIIRVANTGISALIDNLGRIVKHIKLNTMGTI